MGDKIAGQEHGVGLEAVDSIDGVVEEEWLGELIEVNVTELCNMEAVEGGRKIRQTNLQMGDFEEMACDFARVERKA